MKKQYGLNIIGHQLKLQGMQQAIDTTEQVCPNWAHLAYAKLTEFCRLYGSDYIFLGEQFREWAQANGLPNPVHGRAYGAIMHKGARAGLFRKIGYGITSNPNAHNAYSTLWEIL